MEDLTDLDLRVLDLLREDARSAELLAAASSVASAANARGIGRVSSLFETN